MRFRPALVVLLTALAAGYASGLPLESTVAILGRGFADFRLMTLFLLTLPAIGLAERYGLREQSARLIASAGAASPGRILIVYQLLRVLQGILGIRLNGHPVFARPVVLPMVEAAAPAAPPLAAERLKCATAAAENYGNFFGQNLSPAQAGVLLVYGVLSGLGAAPGMTALVLWAIPVASLSVLFAAVQFLLLDRKPRT